ncbi:MAG TPA: hypothetical protein VN732_03340, partial [Solirubrobacterales bacterium]|nr:hypothetical protein [Solirubrobacterales bacterium]
MLLLLTGAVLGGVVAAAFLYGRQRPDAPASLEARLPSPQTWTRLSSAREAKTDLPLEGEFRAIVFESPAVTGPGRGTSTITLR